MRQYSIERSETRMAAFEQQWWKTPRRYEGEASSAFSGLMNQGSVRSSESGTSLFHENLEQL